MYKLAALGINISDMIEDAMFEDSRDFGIW